MFQPDNETTPLLKPLVFRHNDVPIIKVFTVYDVLEFYAYAVVSIQLLTFEICTVKTVLEITSFKQALVFKG